MQMVDSVRERLADIKAPTTIVWGMADGVLPASFGERFHRGIRGAILFEVSGCGHLPQQECPAIVSKALNGGAR